jgi:hypothetical protein
MAEGHDMNIQRRSFLAGLAAVLVAPAIVRPQSLMRVSVPRLVVPLDIVDSEFIPVWPRFRTLDGAMSSYAGMFEVNTIAPATTALPKYLRLDNAEIEKLWKEAGRNIDRLASKRPQKQTWPPLDPVVGEFRFGSFTHPISWT